MASGSPLLKSIPRRSMIYWYRQIDTLSVDNFLSSTNSEVDTSTLQVWSKSKYNRSRYDDWSFGCLIMTDTQEAASIGSLCLDGTESEESGCLFNIIESYQQSQPQHLYYQHCTSSYWWWRLCYWGRNTAFKVLKIQRLKSNVYFRIHPMPLYPECPLLTWQALNVIATPLIQVSMQGSVIVDDESLNIYEMV